MKNQKRHVCVIGLGFFGAGLARSLARDAEVLAIDNDLGRVNAISEDVQRALAVDVRDFHAFSSAVTDRFDEAVVSIGEELESSILCTLYLKRLRVPIIRAKASSEEHAEILRSIGATEVIFPELETAERVAMKILHPNLLDFVPLTGDYVAMDLSAPPVFFGRSLESLHFRNQFNVFVIAIKKSAGEQILFLPGPEYTIAADDALVVIGQKGDVAKLQEFSQKSEG